MLTIKQQIWELTKDLDLIQEAKQFCGNPENPLYWQDVFSYIKQKLEKPVTKKKKPERPVLHSDHIERYVEANRKHVEANFPHWYNDGHWFKPDIPNTNTANGLQTFICNYLFWTGHFANRTGNEGRVIMKDGEAKRITSSSKNGMQDIDTNIKHPSHPFGIPWKIEVKVGKDTHKEHQKKYGKQVQKTGGVYSVVKNVEDFFKQLDELLLT